MLQYLVFEHPANLCDWVNDNSKQINVHSITIDQFGKFILFYSISEGIEDFDPDLIYQQLRYDV